MISSKVYIKILLVSVILVEFCGVWEFSYYLVYVSRDEIWRFLVSINIYYWW